ncbi:MAG: PIN domain nuclease [Spirochaetaceae bacterium]|jgi:predicted nucleic acid-binding protein|nr:PIN domain nuclease [Spirochaetaceae bacterium]
MVVVDTSVWIEYVNGGVSPYTDALDAELAAKQVATGDIIITEFLQGFPDDADFAVAKEIMDRLVYFDMRGKDIAVKAAQNLRILRKHGVTIRKPIDITIATFCIEHGFSLLHNDRDFDPMQMYFGLEVYKILPKDA